MGRRVMVLVVALDVAAGANPGNRAGAGELRLATWRGIWTCCPVSVMWSRATRNGALAEMIIGAVTVIVWKQYGWLDPARSSPPTFGSPIVNL